MIIYVILLGLIFGSFSNVLILRGHTGESLLLPSRCPHCCRQIAWYDLAPVVSFFLLGGQCRFCKKSISIQYPLIELYFGALFGGIHYFINSQVMAIYFCGLTFILSVIAIGDYLYMEIDDLTVIVGVLWVLGWKTYMGGLDGFGAALAGGGTGILIAVIIYGLGYLGYGKEVFGVGDITLSAVIGAAAGYFYILPTYILAWLLILAYALWIKFMDRQKDSLHFSPFAPALIIAWAVMPFINFMYAALFLWQ